MLFDLAIIFFAVGSIILATVGIAFLTTYKKQLQGEVSELKENMDEDYILGELAKKEQQTYEGKLHVLRRSEFLKAYHAGSKIGDSYEPPAYIDLGDTPKTTHIFINADTVKEMIGKNYKWARLLQDVFGYKQHISKEELYLQVAKSTLKEFYKHEYKHHLDKFDSLYNRLHRRINPKIRERGIQIETKSEAIKEGTLANLATVLSTLDQYTEEAKRINFKKLPSWLEDMYNSIKDIERKNKTSLS